MTRFLKVLLPTLLLATMASPLIGSGIAGAAVTLTSVTVGAQSGTVTYAGGSVTFPVTVAATHSFTSDHGVNVTAVSDASAAVSFGSSASCVDVSSSGNQTFNVTVNVPA
ncbi:MAG: hypothetical protein WCA31_05050, partial [Acidimicrobiales bacterium]